LLLIFTIPSPICLSLFSFNFVQQDLLMSFFTTIRVVTRTGSIIAWYYQAMILLAYVVKMQ
jgi:hypothetical protein